MIITLYGPDSYRRIRKLNEIIKEYYKRHNRVSYIRFDMGDDDAMSILERFVCNRSVFGESQLIIIDNLPGGQDHKELKAILKGQMDTQNITIIINLDKKPPSIFKFIIDKAAQTQEFALLTGERLIIFIKKVAKDYGVDMDKKTIDTLINIMGGDTWRLVTEIGKLSFSIDSAIEPSSSEFYSLINILKRGPLVEQRLPALERLLSERHDDTGRIFNTVAFYPKNSNEAERLADFDVEIKSGRLEYEEVLLELALGI